VAQSTVQVFSAGHNKGPNDGARRDGKAAAVGACAGAGGGDVAMVNFPMPRMRNSYNFGKTVARTLKPASYYSPPLSAKQQLMVAESPRLRLFRGDSFDAADSFLTTPQQQQQHPEQCSTSDSHSSLRALLCEWF
jgi:hypothetical protein